MGRKKLSWTQTDAVCPFFVSENRRAASVSCEGHGQDVQLNVQFKSLAERDRFMGSHCCRFESYKSCPYYNFLLTAKYSGKE